MAACSRCHHGLLSLEFNICQCLSLKKVHQKVQLVAAIVLYFPHGTAAVILQIDVSCLWLYACEVLYCTVVGTLFCVKLVMFKKNLNGLFFAQLVHSGPGLCDNGKWFLCMDALSDVHPPVSKHWRQLNILTVLLLLYPFNGLFSRTTWVSWYQKGKTSLDLNEVWGDGMVLGWQRHQLDHMQTICTLLQTDNHTNTHTHTHPFNGPFSGAT